MGDPRLKPLQMEAVSSFSSLKYLTVDVRSVETVVQTLKSAADDRPWHARGAALVFLQVRRHTFFDAIPSHEATVDRCSGITTVCS